MEIVARCFEAILGIIGEEEAERIEGVEVFKNLRWLLDRSGNDWPEVLRNIRKASQVWGRIKLLRR